MLDYGLLEDEIVSRLNDRFVKESVTDNFLSVVRPENEADIKKVYEKGVAFVAYADSLFTNSQSIDQVVQRETVKIRVFMVTDNLRGDNGHYKLNRWVKLSLVGYQPNHCSNRLYISDYKEISYDNGRWSCMLEFTTETSLGQESYDEPIIGGAFQGFN